MFTVYVATVYMCTHVYTVKYYIIVLELVQTNTTTCMSLRRILYIYMTSRILYYL